MSSPRDQDALCGELPDALERARALHFIQTDPVVSRALAENALGHLEEGRIVGEAGASAYIYGASFVVSRFLVHMREDGGVPVERCVSAVKAELETEVAAHIAALEIIGKPTQSLEQTIGSMALGVDDAAVIMATSD